MFRTRGRIYHRDLEIKFEEASEREGVLQCEVINTTDRIHCKHWNKNRDSMTERGKQHYLKIQSAQSFTDVSIQLGVLIGIIKTMFGNCRSKSMFILSFLEYLPELIGILRCQPKLVSRAIMRCVPLCSRLT